MADKTHLGKSKAVHEQRKRDRRIQKLTRRLDQADLTQAERIRIDNELARLLRQPVAF